MRWAGNQIGRVRDVGIVSLALLGVALVLHPPRLEPLFAALGALGLVGAAAARLCIHFVCVYYRAGLRAMAQGRCPHCGYEVGAPGIARCPECGVVPARWRERARAYLHGPTEFL